MVLKAIPVRNQPAHNRARDRHIACIGQKFGRLTVSSVRHEFQQGRFHWLFDCVCECGNRRLADVKSITSGAIVSCGCYAREKIAKVSYNQEKVCQRSKSLRENITSSDKRRDKLPRHIYHIKDSTGRNYFANYVLHGKTIYVGGSQSVPDLMREVAKSKIQNNVWTQEQADAYLATW